MLVTGWTLLKEPKDLVVVFACNRVDSVRSIQGPGINIKVREGLSIPFKSENVPSDGHPLSFSLEKLFSARYWANQNI